MFFKKIDHVGIVVRDLAKAVNAYSVGLNFSTGEIVEIPDVKLRVAVMQVGGIGIELLEYGDPGIPVAALLGAKQAGLNHVCYEVDNIGEAIEELTSSQLFKLVPGFPRKGVRGTIAFLIPLHNDGERIEILEVDHG